MPAPMSGPKGVTQNTVVDRNFTIYGIRKNSNGGLKGWHMREIAAKLRDREWSSGFGSGERCSHGDHSEPGIRSSIVLSSIAHFPYATEAGFGDLFEIEVIPLGEILQFRPQRLF